MPPTTRPRQGVEAMVQAYRDRGPSRIPLSQRAVPYADDAESEAADGHYRMSMPETSSSAAMAMRPLSENRTESAHLFNLVHQGHTLLPSVLPRSLLLSLRKRFDQLVLRAQRGELSAHAAVDPAGIVEIAKVYELDSAFEVRCRLSAAAGLVR